MESSVICVSDASEEEADEEEDEVMRRVLQLSRLEAGPGRDTPHHRDYRQNFGIV